MANNNGFELMIATPYNIGGSLCPVASATRHVAMWTRVHILMWQLATGYKPNPIIFPKRTLPYNKYTLPHST